MTDRIDANFIANEEGERLIPYKDSRGYPTIGIGHMILPNEMSYLNCQITKERSRQLFANDSAIALHHIDVLLGGRCELNRNQLTAVASLVFNNGSTPLERGHTLGDALRRRDYAAAAEAFLLYHHDHEHGYPCNSACTSLLHRRGRERVLFLTPVAVQSHDTQPA